MGLPNPGAEVAAGALARARRVAPRLASVADEDVGAATETVDLLAPHVEGFELNASSPNAPWRHDAEHMGRLLGAIRGHTELPVLLKLPPFTNDGERATVLELARRGIDAGAHGLVCSNTIPVGEPRLAAGRGGLSGAPLRDLTPRIVSDVAASTGAAVPIVASGGISTVADVRACLDAGATAVQLYTGLIYRGPGDRRRPHARVGGCVRGRGVRDRLSADCGTQASRSVLPGSRRCRGAGEGEAAGVGGRPSGGRAA